MYEDPAGILVCSSDDWTNPLPPFEWNTALASTPEAATVADPPFSIIPRADAPILVWTWSVFTWPGERRTSVLLSSGVFVMIVPGPFAVTIADIGRSFFASLGISIGFGGTSTGFAIAFVGIWIGPLRDGLYHVGVEVTTPTRRKKVRRFICFLERMDKAVDIAG